jgi:hypothetical protein
MGLKARAPRYLRCFGLIRKALTIVSRVEEAVTGWNRPNGRMPVTLENASMLRLILLVTFGIAIAAPVSADKRPVIHPDGTVVYGEWGLAGIGNVVPYAEYWGPQYYFVPLAPRGYYFPSNAGDPFAYRSRATRQPSIPGPRYQRNWSTESNAPADLPRGPSVIPAPQADDDDK